MEEYNVKDLVKLSNNQAATVLDNFTRAMAINVRVHFAFFKLPKITFWVYSTHNEQIRSVSQFYPVLFAVLILTQVTHFKRFSGIYNIFVGIYTHKDPTEKVESNQRNNNTKSKKKTTTNEKKRITNILVKNLTMKSFSIY